MGNLFLVYVNVMNVNGSVDLTQNKSLYQSSQANVLKSKMEEVGHACTPITYFNLEFHVSSTGVSMGLDRFLDSALQPLNLKLNYLHDENTP